MIFRKTDVRDINRIMEIINQAQRYFKENSIDQWQNGYPSIQTIEDDISSGFSYVLLQNEVVVATAAISFAGEPDYNKIYDGGWISHNKYGVIHRMAVDHYRKGTGVALEFMKRMEALCIAEGIHSIKIDTHRQNIPMQKFLKKNKFEYCGVIYLKDNSERLAFEKIIS